MIFNEVFVSQLIGRPVIDKVGNEVGRVRDLFILPHEQFPKICGISVKRNRDIVYIPDAQIAMLNKQIVSLTHLRQEIESPGHSPEAAIALKRGFLDHQIVDIDGAKVVRVNDLKITQVHQDYRLVAVDIGFRGLLRRIGIEKWVQNTARRFHRTIPEHLVSWDYVDPITAHTDEIKLSVPHRKLASLHPYDIAQIVSKLGRKDRTAIFQTFDDATAAETLAEMETDMQASILSGMNNDRAADILEIMASDDAADVLNELPDQKAEELLGLMERDEADDVKELREYDDKEAGSLMTTEFIALEQHLTAAQTIDKLRELAPEAETIYYIYVVDQQEHLVGVLSLRELIVAQPATTLTAIMRTKIRWVHDEAPLDDVLNMIRKYDLLAVPVLDQDMRLVGIITVDDVIDAVMPRRRRHLLKFS